MSHAAIAISVMLLVPLMQQYNLQVNYIFCRLFRACFVISYESCYYDHHFNSLIFECLFQNESTIYGWLIDGSSEPEFNMHSGFYCQSAIIYSLWRADTDIGVQEKSLAEQVT